MLIELQPHNLDQRKLEQLVSLLKGGGIIIYPTDTVYSVGCSLQRPDAIEKLERLKGIKKGKANFSIICSDLSHLSEFSKQVNNQVYKLMRNTLPGPFTYIVEASKSIPKLFAGNKKTVGIRIPDHPVPLALVDLLGCPIITTSIHDSDGFLDYPTDPDEIYSEWHDKVDAVIDAGAGGFLPSTVIDCSEGTPTLVRQGKGEVELIGD
jgi:tRNA threonylcarbamoyl adenosine modification protein (Sua5/YciO/YrdC/YwlC family)